MKLRKVAEFGCCQEDNPKLAGALLASKQGSFSLQLQGMSCTAFSHQYKPVSSTFKFYSSNYSLFSELQAHREALLPPCH